MINFKNY